MIQVLSSNKVDIVFGYKSLKIRHELFLGITTSENFFYIKMNSSDHKKLKSVTGCLIFMKYSNWIKLWLSQHRG